MTDSDHSVDGEHVPEWATDRSTAPQSGYTGRDVLLGALIALIGVLVTFGIPAVLL
jgi:hypothetical protein